MNQEETIQEQYEEAPEILRHPHKSTSCISVVRNWNSNLRRNFTDDNAQEQINALYGDTQDKNAYWLLNSAFNDRYRTSTNPRTFGKNTCVIPTSLASSYGLTVGTVGCTGTTPDGIGISLSNVTTYDHTISEHEGCVITQDKVTPFLQYMKSYFGYDKQREKRVREEKNDERRVTIDRLNQEIETLREEIEKLKRQQRAIRAQTEDAKAQREQMIRETQMYNEETERTQNLTAQREEELEKLTQKYAFLDNMDNQPPAPAPAPVDYPISGWWQFSVYGSWVEIVFEPGASSGIMRGYLQERWDLIKRVSNSTITRIGTNKYRITTTTSYGPMTYDVEAISADNIQNVSSAGSWTRTERPAYINE